MSFIKPNIFIKANKNLDETSGAKDNPSVGIEQDILKKKNIRPYYIESIPSFKSLNMDLSFPPETKNKSENSTPIATKIDFHDPQPEINNTLIMSENANSSRTHIGAIDDTQFQRNEQNQKDSVPPIYKYYPSNNRFLFKGRLITGNEPLVFTLTHLLIIIPFILFGIFICPYLWVKIHIAVPIVFIMLFIQSLLLLWKTSFSDPGIVPKKPEGDYFIDVRDVPSIEIERGYIPSAPPKFTTVNGIEIRLKYCDSCGIYRPPRASHCSQCDSCIERMDHHCVWVNNCIGKRNYRYFFLFLSSILSYCVYILIFSILHLYWVNEELIESGINDFLEVLRMVPMSLVLAIISFFFTISLSCLFTFHFYLIIFNKTTHEKFRSGGVTYEGNPFDQGNPLSNCFDVLCSPIPPTNLNWRSRDPEFHSRFQLPTDFDWV